MLIRCEGCIAKKSENINDKILAATLTEPHFTSSIFYEMPLTT